MLLYFVIGATTLAALFFAAKRLSVAKAATVKKVLLIFVACVAVVVLLRFGMPIAAAAVAAFPIIQRIVSAVLTIRQVRHFFKGAASGQNNQNSSANRSPMSHDEAKDILGVAKNATDKEIKDAYQQLMKKNHPDAGGSKYFATQLNQAKDVLLKKRKS